MAGDTPGHDTGRDTPGHDGGVWRWGQILLRAPPCPDTPGHDESAAPDQGHGRGGKLYSCENAPDLPPSLWVTRSASIRIDRSTALHMSYTVSAATLAAVSASISTPV
jgi:hypothetical protein